MKQYLFIVFCIALPAFAQNSELIEKVSSGSSLKTEVAAAKKEVLDQVTEEVSEELIKELIGEDRFLKNRHLLPSKVFKNSSRYIPFTKIGEPEPLAPGPGFRIPVQLRVSLSSLRGILQNQGLLSEGGVQPVVLPLVSIVDRLNGRTIKWWQIDDIPFEPDMLRKANILETSLRKNFRKNDFFVIGGIENQWGRLIPTAFHGEHLGPTEIQNLGRFFRAPIAIVGSLVYQKESESSSQLRIEIKMTAYQVSNHKTLADVSRKYTADQRNIHSSIEKRLKETLDGVCSDLATQISEAWLRGSVGTNLMRIAIRGKFNILEREKVKEKIQTYVPQIKNVRDRAISPDQYILEVESSSPGREISGKISTLEVLGKKLTLISESEHEIVFKL